MLVSMATANRTVVMTGASGGIGHQAAKHLLAEAPDVALVLLARSKADDLAEGLTQQTGNSNVRALTADLSSVSSIRAATAAVRADLERRALPPLTGLIGDAGVQLTRATDTSDGHEMTFAVNILANYVLVKEFMDSFADPARVVLTTSDTHFGDFKHTMGFVPAPIWREPRALATPGTAKDAGSSAAGRTAYSTSKLGLIYLTHEFARRLPSNVTIYSFNPGLVPGTGLVRDAGGLSDFMFRHIMPAMTIFPFARSIKTSGNALAEAFLRPAFAPSGSYLNGTNPERSSDESYDEAREAALWDELTRLAAPASGTH